MQTAIEQQNSRTFVDRRSQGAPRDGVPERRQFTASVTNTNPAIAELAEAVDQYKLRHHRRFIGLAVLRHGSERGQARAGIGREGRQYFGDCAGSSRRASRDRSFQPNDFL